MKCVIFTQFFSFFLFSENSLLSVHARHQLEEMFKNKSSCGRVLPDVFFFSGFATSNKVGICPKKVFLKKTHMGVTHKDFCQTQKSMMKQMIVMIR